MKITDVMFPRGAVCLACDRPSYGESLCPRCRRELKEKRLREPARPGVFMDGLCSAWPYAGAAQTLVHRLKFDAAVDAADVLAAGMADTVRQADFPDKLLVTSVPMPAGRRRARGVDHGMELAMRVATELSLPFRPLMMRRKGVRSQRGLSRAKRLTNLQHAFDCEELHGEHILLVDDVLTTGATVISCAQTLRQAGAGGVWVVTATRTEAGRRKHWLRKLFRRKGRV